MSARFGPSEAKSVAKRIRERGASDANPIQISQGLWVVEVRSKVRPYPLVATLRTNEDTLPFLGGTE